MRIIPRDEYALVRKKFLYKNTKLVKAGTQDMIRCFESGRNFSGREIEYKRDFDAILLNELRNEDDDVRKWLYHLLCLYTSQEKEKQLLDSCLDNIPLEVSSNKENISWIAAVCGVHSEKQSDFETYVKMSKFQDYLSIQQIRLAGSAFRNEPFYPIDHAMLQKAMHPDDHISAIWLTKVFANQFLPIVSRNQYNKNHGNMQIDMFIELLKHPNDVVRKYTMWAFAQERGGNLNSIIPYVPLSNVFSLESGVLKWFFVKMFQDSYFLDNNKDFLEHLKPKLGGLEPNDREGILIGCAQLGYQESIADILIDWEIGCWETNENILLRLYEYFLKNINKNDNFYEIIESAIANIDTIHSSAIRNLLLEFMKTKKGKDNMKIGNINVFGGNPQINTGGNNTQINSAIQAQDQDQIYQKLIEIQEQLEQQDYYADEKYNNLIAHLDYELDQMESVLKDYLQSDEISAIRQHLSDLEKLKNAPPKERGHRIMRAIATIADLITIASSMQFYPEIMSFAQNTAIYMQELLG